MPAPIIYYVTPKLEPTTGLSVAQIVGRNFDLTGTISVGGAPPSVIEGVSSFLAQIVCPARAAGPQDVVLSTSQGTATAVGAIRYV
jgi:hypothetical protein